MSKIIENKTLIIQVIELFDKNISTRQIAKDLQISRRRVKQILSDNNVDINTHERRHPKKETPTHKICCHCPEKGLQPIANFTTEIRKDGSVAIKHCRECTNKLAREARHDKNGPPIIRKIELTTNILNQINELHSQKYSINKIVKTLKIPRRVVELAYEILHLSAKPTYTEIQIAETKDLFYKGFGEKRIAKKLEITRYDVQHILEILDIDNSGRKLPRTAYLATEKMCKDCPENGIQPIANFRKRYDKKTDRISFEPYCLKCAKIRTNEASKKNSKRRRKEDPSYKLRCNVSWSIFDHLRRVGCKKNNNSCLKYLPQSIEDMQKYIEISWSNPENLTHDGKVWMNWQNWGVYNQHTWNDADQSTWTWQVDHIKPHSEFHYITMDCDEFRACWALSNLRPLSAKINHDEGVNRTRHTPK